MSESKQVNRRGFLGTSAAALAVGSAALTAEGGTTPPTVSTQATPAVPHAQPGPNGMPYGMLGKVRLSRLLLGGNLVTGCMHCRDLKYVGELFRAYVTEDKIMQTFKLAEQHGINAVFESGAQFVHRYNKEFGGHMQIIPSIHPELSQSDAEINDEIKRNVDAGVPALYVWGARSDDLVRVGRVDVIAKAVELAKKFNIPVGVGGHSLLVPKACEQAKVPCDFYVKTFHNDDYPTATPKALRKEWFQGPGFFDNMWCIDPQETAEFMASVAKPWIAFKVLAAGAILPRQGFAHAFRNGADFIAVGMFDFQIKEDCELATRIVEMTRPQRKRPWYS
ncbi:MAG: hypothetical protein ABSF26_07060 [Thermoguttaceae bacterium]|jgi:hypothetical protein